MTEPERDGTTGASEGYVVRHDWDEDDALSSTVINAVAAIRNVEPTAVDPLNRAVDPDALNAIFANRCDGNERAGASLTIRLNGCRVTVDGDGRILVVPPASDSPEVGTERSE